MRIAVSSDTDRNLDSAVSHHFGRCPYFTIVDVDNGSIQNFRVVENPFFNSHAPGQVPSFIRELEADVMIAGGMGRRAIAMLTDFGIDFATGASGTVGAAVDDFLSGGLTGASPCRESIQHAHRDSGYEKEDPAYRLKEEAAALLEQVDDVIVRLPDKKD